MPKDDSANQAAGQAAQAQTALAQELIGETRPLRQNLISDAFGFLSGDRDVTGLPEFAAAKGANEAQFGRARENIIGSTPTGGALTSALGNLEGQRASNQVAFTGDIAGNEINRALQLATFGAAQGSRGLGSAGFIQAQRAGAEGAQNAAKSQGLGQALGGLLGGK